MKWLFAPLLWLGLIHPQLFALQNEVEPTELDQRNEDMWTKIDGTLNNWQIATGFDDESKQTIHDARADAVDDFIKTYMEREERGYVKGLPVVLEEKLKLNLRDSAGEELLDALRQDEKLVQQFNRQTAITSVVARMDLGLALSADQIDQLAECLIENWDSSEYKYSSPAYSRTLPRGNFPDQVISQTLNPIQNEYWIQNRKKDPAGEEITFHYAADDACRIEKFSPKLDAAIALRVQVIQQQFTLDEKQVGKLNLLVKRHRQKLLELRESAYRDVEMVRDMGRPPTDSPLSGRATMTASALLGSEGSWTAFVRKTLTGSDRDTYELLTAKRQKLHHSANTYNLTRVYKRWAGLCGQQMFDFYEPCFENIARDSNWIRGDRGMYFAVKDIPEPGINGIISERQQQRLQSWSNNINALHRMIDEERRKNAAKAKEENKSE